MYLEASEQNSIFFHLNEDLLACIASVLPLSGCDYRKFNGLEMDTVMEKI